MEIKNIKSAPLQQFGNQIDSSKVSKHDGKINAKELNIFKQRA